MTETPDWKSGDKDLIQEALRQADLRIENQVRLAISADQRAAVLAAIYTAASTVLAAGIITMVADGHIIWPIITGGGIAAVLFFIGAASCIYTSRPVNFHVAGNDPKNWYNDINEGKDLKVALGEVAQHLQEGISENRKIIERNAKFYWAGARLGIAAPLVGAIIWMVAFTIGSSN